MRVLQLLPLVAAASAFVIPDEQTLKSLSLETQETSPHSFIDDLPSTEDFWGDLAETYRKAAHCTKHKLDEAVDYAFDAAVKYSDKFDSAFAGEQWLQTADYDLDLVDETDKPPHHGPPHRLPPGHGPGKPGKKKPHHPPHHGKPNMTVYELIAKSNYTTKLAELINEFDDLVELLNGTTANFTVFAPTNAAFAKIPKHHGKPPKEFLKKVLTYHVSPEFYPAGRVLVTRTIPTALEASYIGKVPQRLSTQVGLRGLTVNFYSRIVAFNIFGTNGVIHGIDSILLPPPKVIDIIKALPGEFSTLELGLTKTGLVPAFSDPKTHSGGTLFAPSNFAFKKLGPRVNAFLFSKYGEKYLKALLLYHVADNITLYSDAIYKTGETEHSHEHHRPGVPKGFFHVDLPTGLEGKSLSIDVARYGRLITIKINGFTKVAVTDGIASDGVIHVVPNVLIPPKTPGAADIATEDMTVEEFKARLEPMIEVDEWNIEL